MTKKEISIRAINALIKSANWIHPQAMEMIKSCVPEQVTQIAPGVYEVYDTVFMVPGSNINVGQIIGFLVDHGWDGDTHGWEPVEDDESENA